MSGPLDTMRAIAALDISMRHKAVLWVLVLTANNVTAECFPSYVTIAKRAGCGKSTAKNTVRELVEMGHISKRSQRRVGSLEADSNVYTIHVVSSATHLGQELTHVGQHTTHVGQDTDHGGSGADRGVGQDPTGGGSGAGQYLPKDLPTGTAYGTADERSATPPQLLVEAGEAKTPRGAADAHREIFETWVKARRVRFRLNGCPRLDKARRDAVDAALALGYSVNELKAAVRGYVLNNENKYARRAEGFVWALEESAKIDAGVEALPGDDPPLNEARP